MGEGIEIARVTLGQRVVRKCPHVIAAAHGFLYGFRGFLLLGGSSQFIIDGHGRRGTDTDDPHEHCAGNERDEDLTPLPSYAVGCSNNHWPRASQEVPVRLHEAGQFRRDHV